MQSRMMWMLAAVLTATSLAGVFAGEPPDAVALKISQPPRLDGRLDESFWQEARPLGDFHVFARDAAGRRVSDTAIRLAYDDTWLYAGVQCDNPLQSLVLDPAVREHDGAVHMDESVELFFAPDGSGKVYYHFLLSCFNVKAEQRFIDGQRERETWNLPWRSAAVVTDKGWTAELAIPLYLFVEYGDFDKIRLNVCRNRRAPFMDAQKVITHEERESSLWQPVVRTFHEAGSFGALAPLTPGKLQVPFLASLERVEVKPYFNKDGENHYAVEVETRGANAREGEAELRITDQPLHGAPRTIAKKFRVAGTALERHTLEIPAPTPVARDVAVELRDAASGEVFQARHVGNPAVLKIMDAWLDRNYYTLEQEAAAVAAVALPPASIANMRVSVELAGQTVAGAAAGAETVVRFAVKALPVGRHPVKIALLHADGRPFYAVDVELIKRAPNPGLEWKIDQIDRVVIQPDGTPFFPFGPVMSGVAPGDDADFKKIAGAGCNTFFQWNRSLAATNANAFLETAAKYGIYVVSQLETGWLPLRSAGLALPEKLLPPDEARRILAFGRSGSTAMRGMLMESRAAHPDKTAVFGEYFDKNIPLTRELIAGVKTYPNLLAYNTFDEPCENRFFNITRYLEELRRVTHTADGYHPVMLLYSSHIPAGDEYVTGGDILCTDPYWIPGGDVSRAGRNTPNYVSKIVYWNDLRAQKFRQPVWIVPVAWEWSGARKRGINAAEQDCQNFLAVIHGARGLFWFRYPMPEIAWSNLQAAMVKVKTIGPMAVQPAVRQEIKYLRAAAPETEFQEAVFLPERDEFPDVQGRIFRDPADGGLVLVAANSRYYPVVAQFTVCGLAGSVKSVFGGQILPVRGGMFKENLEPFAVRAYRLGGKLSAPAALTIAAIRPGKIPPPETTWANNVRPGKKNVLPNPSLEEENVAGVPDYCFGESALAPEPGIAKFGAKCLKITNAKSQGYTQVYWKCAPQHDRETPYVFSFWAKGAQGGEAFWARIREGAEKSFVLTPEWERYVVTGTVPPRLGDPLYLELRLPKAGAAWVDGVQFEAGYAATEFEE